MTLGGGVGNRRLVIVLGLSVGWLILSCAPALAHARLTEMYPGAGANLAEPPEQVRLTFSEPVEAEFGPIEVYDQRGERVDRDNARVDPDNANVLAVDFEENIPEGSYRVQWRVSSLDGHVIDGAYRFAVSGSEAEATEPEDEGTGDPEERAAEGQGEGPAGGIGWVTPVSILAAIAAAVVGFVALRRR